MIFFLQSPEEIDLQCPAGQQTFLSTCFSHSVANWLIFTTRFLQWYSIMLDYSLYILLLPLFLQSFAVSPPRQSFNLSSFSVFQSFAAMEPSKESVAPNNKQLRQPNRFFLLLLLGQCWSYFLHEQKYIH